MKQIARIRMNGGNTVRIRLKENAATFEGPDGLLYNAPNAPGEWGIEKGLLGPVQEALYHEGIPQPVGSKEVETLALNGHGDTPIKVKARVPAYAGFTAADYTRVHGEPIVRWLTEAMKRAAGGLVVQYITLGLSAGALLASALSAYWVYKHIGG